MLDILCAVSVEVTATLGVDLASQSQNTALCAIEWEPRRATVTTLLKGFAPDGVTPLHDKLLVSAMRGLWGGLPAPSKVAIDAPLGWPVDFVRGIFDLADWPVGIDNNRRRLERRATDHWVHDTAKKQPLSVTTDRIAYAAMRAAGILSHYVQISDEEIDRSGATGLVCEAYPDPSIRLLGLWPDQYGARVSYKGNASDVREAVVQRLGTQAPWLELAPEHRLACVASDDCLDALICALVARATERSLTVDPPPELAAEAAAEGWIRLPEPHCLEELI